MSANGRGGLWQPGSGLRARYARLAPDERFRATLEAAARDDDDERQSLVLSCPRKRYEMSDTAFIDRVDASRDLAVAVALELGPRLARVRTLEVMRELLGQMNAALVEVYADADTGGQPDQDTTWPLLDTLEQGASELRSQAAAVLEAFGAVCRSRLRLDPQTVLRAHLGELHLTELGLGQLEKAKADKATVRQWRKMLARKWGERVGG